MEDEFDKFLDQHDGNEDNTENAAPPGVDEIMASIDSLIAAALGDSNQITFQVTRVHPDKRLVWTATIGGVFVSVDTFGEMMSALMRLS